MPMPGIDAEMKALKASHEAYVKTEAALRGALAGDGTAEAEQRIAAAKVHIDRARAYASADVRAELVTALDVLNGEAGL